MLSDSKNKFSSKYSGQGKGVHSMNRQPSQDSSQHAYNSSGAFQSQWRGQRQPPPRQVRKDNVMPGQANHSARSNSLTGFAGHTNSQFGVKQIGRKYTLPDKAREYEEQDSHPEGPPIDECEESAVEQTSLGETALHNNTTMGGPVNRNAKMLTKEDLLALKDQTDKCAKRAIAEIKFSDNPDEEAEAVFDWCVQVVQAVFTNLSRRHAKLLLKNIQTICQMQEIEEAKLGVNNEDELKASALNEKLILTQTKIERNLDKIRGLVIDKQQEAKQKVDEIESKIESAAKSLGKLRQQVNDLDTDELVLDHRQKPMLFQSVHENFQVKDDELKAQVKSCNKQLSLITSQTEKFCGQLNKMCRDHMEAIKSHQIMQSNMFGDLYQDQSLGPQHQSQEPAGIFQGRQLDAQNHFANQDLNPIDTTAAFAKSSFNNSSPPKSGLLSSSRKFKYGESKTSSLLVPASASKVEVTTSAFNPFASINIQDYIPRGSDEPEQQSAVQQQYPLTNADQYNAAKRLRRAEIMSRNMPSGRQPMHKKNVSQNYNKEYFQLHQTPQHPSRSKLQPGQLGRSQQQLSFKQMGKHDYNFKQGSNQEGAGSGSGLELEDGDLSSPAQSNNQLFDPRSLRKNHSNLGGGSNQNQPASSFYGDFMQSMKMNLLGTGVSQAGKFDQGQALEEEYLRASRPSPTKIEETADNQVARKRAQRKGIIAQEQEKNRGFGAFCFF